MGDSTMVKKPDIEQLRSMEKINAAMINHAREIAEEIGATAVLVYVDVIKSRENLENLIKGGRCILAARSENVLDDLALMGGSEDRIIRVPYMNLTRTSQVKVAAILALSNGLIQSGDRLVCLSGSPRYGILDSLTVTDVNREFEIFSSKSLDIASQIESPYVFDRLLTLALELAEEGREGKPVGTIFVLGDHEKVMSLSSQMVINPFEGVPEGERNIMDPGLKETIREFAALDGAFVIREDGVVLAAGRHLKASAEDTDLPRGLGARHRSAAGITAVTNALAIVISESTGDVRIFNRGRVFMEIEKGERERTA
ncbi:MAG: DNA integrity scanning protein DisA nucleotide-binding domain protein [Deltaproteobacteria bacterium]|nr:DNA integrity scanning protein DisA nucleotide-binding domain protein [Deltaproteobacteria bacterium]MBW2123862.1 DNA integrity scanning protein DisA nucleotide-binding domain protein [Deltaproteobacteria bacterium]